MTPLSLTETARAAYDRAFIHSYPKGVPMQKMNGNVGVVRMENAMRFLGIRLKSRPETTVLGNEVETVRNELRTAHETYLMALEQRVGATAEIEYIDALLDEQVMQLSRDVLMRTKNNRDDARYKMLFTNAPSETMRPMGGDVQDRAVRAIVATLEKEQSLAELRTYVPTLKEHTDRLNRAMAAREELYAPEQSALAKRTTVMDKTRRFYNLMPARLTVMFPNDPAFVASCFRDLYVRRDESVSETTTETNI